MSMLIIALMTLLGLESPESRHLLATIRYLV